MNYLDDYKNLLTIKRYSYKTISAYSNALKNFLNDFSHLNPDRITASDIENYLNFKVHNNKISQSYQKILVGAIKLFYNELLRKNYKLNYLYPDRVEKRLPTVLDKSEVELLLSSIENLD